MANEDKQESQKKELEDEYEGMSPFARTMTELAPFLNLGWVFVASIGAFAALGWWLDTRLGTGQTWLAIGATFGIAIGFVNFFKVVLNIGKKRKDQR